MVTLAMWKFILWWFSIRTNDLIGLTAFQDSEGKFFIPCSSMHRFMFGYIEYFVQIFYLNWPSFRIGPEYSVINYYSANLFAIC